MAWNQLRGRLPTRIAPSAALRNAINGQGLRLLILLVPLVLLLLGIQYEHSHTWADPTSRFFDPSRAFALRRYTNVRLAEARHFIEKYNATDGPAFRRELSSDEPPYMCVGVSTIMRPGGAVYVRNTLASMLDGLSQKERNQLQVMPLIGHINATEHPIYMEPWLERVADRVLTYENSMAEAPRQHVYEIEMERKKTGVVDREKAIIDYTHAMKTCEQTKAPYILMLEDDVLFLDGWFHRTRKALKEVEWKVGDDPHGWFYLRLFYVTRNLGDWTDSDKFAYYGIAALLAALLLTLPRTIRSRPPWAAAAAQKAGQSRVLLLMTALLTFIVATFLFFSAGRYTMIGEKTGVWELNDACCTQAMVYPSKTIAPLAEWFEHERYGFVDSLSEQLASKKPGGREIGSRWAIGPVVVQHVGGKSSKGDNWGSDKPGELSASQRLWNFMFEYHDADRLAAEHRAAAERFEQERVMGDD